MIMFMRRYLPAMFANRWAGERASVGLGEADRGFYLDAFKAFAQTLRTGDLKLQWLSPREKKSVVRMSTEVAQLIVLFLLAKIVFGWDADDEDRYEKLRQKSGPLPFLGVEDDPEHPFEASGYLANHSLNLLMQIKAESQQWIPAPGLGITDYAQALDWKSVMMGPTITSYVNMIQDLTNAATGNDAAYYKKEVGPYKWQKDESFKFWNHFNKMYGVTGTSMDPVIAMRNYQSIQSRK